MSEADLGRQFEKEVRSLYPEGNVTDAERGLLLDLAAAKGLSRIEAEAIVERCFGVSASTSQRDIPEATSARTSVGATPPRSGSYELAAPKPPSAPWTQLPPEASESLPRLHPATSTGSLPDASASRQEQGWPLKYIIIAAVAAAAAIVVVLLIWKLVT